MHGPVPQGADTGGQLAPGVRDGPLEPGLSALAPGSDTGPGTLVVSYHPLDDGRAGLPVRPSAVAAGRTGFQPPAAPGPQSARAGPTEPQAPLPRGLT